MWLILTVKSKVKVKDINMKIKETLTVKVIFLCSIIIVSFCNTSFANQDAQSILLKKMELKQKLYTSYNLWAFRNNIHAINYQHGKLIPLGIEIKEIFLTTTNPPKGYYFNSDKKIFREEQAGSKFVAATNTVLGESQNDYAGGGLAEDSFYFTTSEGIKYKFIFNDRFHPGKTLADYANAIVSTKSASQSTEGLNQKILSNIRQGLVADGMTKNEVVMAFGYPPEHATTSLDYNIWKYWSNKRERFSVCFDDYGLTTNCTGVTLKILENHSTPKKKFSMVCVEGNCQNGTGTLQINNTGKVYVGSFRNGKRHGFGVEGIEGGEGKVGYWMYGMYVGKEQPEGMK